MLYLVLLSALGSFVNDMYTPSLPEMARYFHCTVSQAQLSLTFGMIGLGVGQLLMGPISDHYGRKIVLVVSLIVFIVGAIASVFSHNMTVFMFSVYSGNRSGWRLFFGSYYSSRHISRSRIG